LDLLSSRRYGLAQRLPPFSVGRKGKERMVRIMKIATSLLAALLLLSALVVGCTPVAAQKDQTMAQKRDSVVWWELNYGD
jgi:hypothetical protein